MNSAIGVGAGMQAGGQLMSGYGEMEGLRAMARERERQIAEWEAENQRQQGFVDTEMARRSAAGGADNVSPLLAQSQGAMRGVGALGGKLGLRGADTARVSGALLPGAAAKASAQGQQVGRMQDAAGTNVMGSNIRQSQLDQQDRAALYDMMLKRAADTGSGWRTVGEGMQQGGQMMSMAGMLGPKPTPQAPAKAGATYQSTGGQAIYPMAQRPQLQNFNYGLMPT